MATEEKVIYGFESLHIAPVSDAHTIEEPAYEKPFSVKGAVTFSPEAQQETMNFFADNRPYFTVTQTASYEGDLTVAKFPDEVHTKILGNIKLGDGGLIDVDGGIQKDFAVLGESRTDSGRVRFMFFLATGGKPTKEYNTIEDGAPEIATETMSLSMSSIRLETEDTPAKHIYAFGYKVREGEAGFDTFFDEVILPKVPATVTP